MINKGKGYGSGWSICSLFLILSALMFLMVMLGVFNFNIPDQTSFVVGIEKEELTTVLGKEFWAVRIVHPIF
jgi:hypothetical protein